jgi:hypothetical protein
MIFVCDAVAPPRRDSGDRGFRRKGQNMLRVVTTGRALFAAVLAIAFSLLAPAAAEAACGARNQTPCKVWERVPSYDKGLKENFVKHQCVK